MAVVPFVKFLVAPRVVAARLSFLLTLILACGLSHSLDVRVCNEEEREGNEEGLVLGSRREKYALQCLTTLLGCSVGDSDQKYVLQSNTFFIASSGMRVRRRRSLRVECFSNNCRLINLSFLRVR